MIKKKSKKNKIKYFEGINFGDLKEIVILNIIAIIIIAATIYIVSKF